MKSCSVFILFCCLTPLIAAAPDFRLGNQVEPVRYAVDLTLTPGRDTFSADIQIDVRWMAPTDEIWLNATGLQIQSAELLTGNAPALPVKVDLKENRFAGFSFGHTLPAGEGRLHIVYSGSVSRISSAGIFQEEEASRWYLYTQFEPTDARRAFPCFDEPNFKVPWQVTLEVPKDLKAFSNTPQISEAVQTNGRKTVRFAQTRPLPSYLIAFAVGPFDVVDAGTVGKDHTRLRIITPHGKADHAKFAAATIPELLNLLEQYFGMPYPYDKLDSIAMPISNFAMENVGLITYSEQLLLADPSDDTLTRQREMAIVAAHEMAHQWFGDLVTTAWWNDIWLNEGFASWMETKIVDEWKPEWRVNLDAIDDRVEAMGLDSLVTARKIRQPIVTESDIANAFDNITYMKGAAVLRMFENWIGPEVFRRGVHAYIQAHADKNATTVEFLAAISASAGRDIAPAFNTFLDRPGVPELNATLRCDNNRPSLHVSQRRYLPIGSPGRSGEDTGTEVWQIPVCVRYGPAGTGRPECVVLSQPSADLPLSRSSCPAWLVPNAGGTGYYYSNPTFTDNGKNLSLPELVSELADVRGGALSGAMKPAAALGVVPDFANHPERHVVDMDTKVAGLVESDFMPVTTWPRAAGFIDRSFGARARSLGWEARASDDDDERLLRHDLVRFVGSHGDDRELVQRAEDIARRWLKDPKTVAAGTLSDVLTVAAEHGNRDFFNRLHAAALALHDREQREIAITALGSFRDPAIARDAMALLLTNDFDIREAFTRLLFGPLAYPETRTLPFEFVKAHLDELLKKLPREVGGDFAADLPAVGRHFCDARQRDDVQAFFKERVKDWVGAPRILDQTVEGINICIGQRNVLEPDVARFLGAQ